MGKKMFFHISFSFDWSMCIAGHILPGLFLLLATTVGCNITAAVAMMCIAVGSSGLISVGSQANNLDVAGRFAGTPVLLKIFLPSQSTFLGITHGISNTFGSIAGFIAPSIAGAITKGDVFATHLISILKM